MAPFDSQELQKTISNMMNSGQITVPDNHKVAFVIHADSNGGVAGAFVAKINSDWRVQSVVDWSHDNGVEAGFNLEWSR